MDEPKDRRSFDRLIFSDVSASIFKNYWYLYLKYKLIQNITSFLPEKSFLQNLSLSGSLILSQNIFKRGDGILLIINAPGIKNFIVKGRVRWISSDSLKQKQIGIQFLAFSHWKKYNSYKIQQQINLFLLLKNEQSIIKETH